MKTEVIGAEELDAIARSAALRWEARREPFTHWVARDLFPAAQYERLAAQMREVIGRGLSQPPDPRKLSYRMKGYDAYSLSITRLGGPLEVFHTRRWHDALAELTGVPSTRDVSAALHHHLPGSADGRVHNDFNPAYFVDAPQEDGVNLNDPKLCHYQFGDTYRPGEAARACARAATMIFFLANGPWDEGDGGETGFYRGPRDAVRSPAAKVQPLDNSALVFECTPSSYHSFLSNRRERNSVILWLHRSRADAIAKFGDGRLIDWKR